MSGNTFNEVPEKKDYFDRMNHVEIHLYYI